MLICRSRPTRKDALTSTLYCVGNITMVIEDNSKSKSSGQLYRRMFLFALIGFAVFFGGAWLRVIQVGAFKYASNPYAGPPPLLMCLFCGGFGSILGAVVSLFKKNR